MSVLGPGLQWASLRFAVLVALGLAIIGVRWFLQRNPQTTISGSQVQTTGRIDNVESREQVALENENFPGQSSPAGAREAYERLPLSLEVNRGRTGAQVKFLSRGTGYNLFLTSTEAVLAPGSPAPSGGEE